MTDAAGGSPVDRLESSRQLWSRGDYASVGDLFAAAGEVLVQRVGVAGLDVLDVATGTGATALAAARAGAARVVGVDLTPALLAEAARRADLGGWAVEWQEGDMEALAVPGAAFDRVVSSFGAMFAADQRATAAGLVRACRPGGRIGVTAWALGGVFDRMSTALVELLPTPPPPGPSPRDWASAASLASIFTGLPVRTTVEERVLGAWFPSSAAAVELLETRAPPIVAVREVLTGAGRWEEAHNRLIELYEGVMVDDGARCRLDLAYTVAVLDVAWPPDDLSDLAPSGQVGPVTEPSLAVVTSATETAEPDELSEAFQSLSAEDWILAGTVFLGALLVSRVVKALAARVVERDGGAGAGRVADLVGRVVGGVVAVGGFVYALQVLGVRLGPLLGALGLGGLAIAFAAQAILSNVFASVLLQARRPFRTGDEISTNDVEGTVEEINLRTVVLRTYDGERVLVPCASVLGAPIFNFTAHKVRRTTLEVGVAYGSDLAAVQRVVLDAVESVDGVQTTPPPEAWVEAFGESSIDFAVRYWHAPDIATLWRVRSGVAMAVKAALDGAGIEIPFPQRTLGFLPDARVRVHGVEVGRGEGDAGEGAEDDAGEVDRERS